MFVSVYVNMCVYVYVCVCLCLWLSVGMCVCVCVCAFGAVINSRFIDEEPEGERN